MPATPNIAPTPEYLSLDDLLLDPENPRFGRQDGVTTQQDILDHIAHNFGVEDILSSLAVNGYFQSEPVVCQEHATKKGKYLVKEGNRRLAACLIINGDERAKSCKKLTEDYQKVWVKHGKPAIDEIPAVVFPSKVESEKALLSYLGVRHISATMTWDSYAKAAWVAQVVEGSKLSLREIARMIGDRHQTISRLLDGYYFVQQLENAGMFQPEDSVRKGRGSVSAYPFSWVYAIIGYASVRNFLGMGTEPKKDPLSREDLQNGQLVLTALVGDKGRARNPAIDDSRQLGRLAQVFGNPTKVGLLKQGKKVDEIESITRPVEVQLADGLAKTTAIQRDLSASLNESKLAQPAAECLLDLSKRNKRLAGAIDVAIREIAAVDEHD